MVKKRFKKKGTKKTQKIAQKRHTSPVVKIRNNPGPSSAINHPMSINKALEATLFRLYSLMWTVFRASDVRLCVSYISIYAMFYEFSS